MMTTNIRKKLNSHNWPLVVLMLLIAVQSIILVIDNHQFSPFHSDHSEHTHQYTHQHNAIDITHLDTQNDHSIDCHYCCHCQPTQAINVSIINLKVDSMQFSSSLLSFYERSIPTPPLTLLLRPPQS